MHRNRTIIFFLIAAIVIAGLSTTFSFWGANGIGRFLHEASLQLNSNNIVRTGSNIDLSTSNYNDTFQVLPDPNPPTIFDPNLSVEKVITDLRWPTSMVFSDNGDIIILEKNDGNVRLVSNGTLQPQPIFQTAVANDSEQGMLGVAIANTTNAEKTVFLYYTESDGDEVKNRVYRYSWNGSGNLTGGSLILDLPGEPGPNHNGGKMKIGPDGMLYAIIGDLNREGMLQNILDGPLPDDTSVILRVDHNGTGVGNPLSAGGGNLSKYYAYGIRNAFGFDFDPLTGILWNAENGPDVYDEINIVLPGFNSGWVQVMGPIERSERSVFDLVHFPGSHYADPVFSWFESRGITDLEFFNSTRLGERYANNIFVGDYIDGNLFFFTVNSNRTGLDFTGIAGLEDLVADNPEEVNAVTLGTGFPRGITDIQTGPDGYLYILTFSGDLYRIVPATPSPPPSPPPFS